MALPDEEQIKLILSLFGFDSIDAAIKSFEDLKLAEGQLTDQQEQAQRALESYRDVMFDVNSVAGKQSDAALQEAQSRRIATEMTNEATEALKRMRAEEERLADVVAKNQETINSLAGSGEGGGGFAALAGQAMKAEKAIHAFASGSGLGRIGSMLGGVLGPQGLPGLGTAIGVLVYAIEPAIPMIKEFCDSWETGIKPIDDATAAVERLGRAQTEARQKRALAKIDSKITALEDKEDEQGWLAPDDERDLRKLREASFSKHQEMDIAKREEDERKLVEKALKDQAKQDARNAEDRVKSDAEKSKHHEQQALKNADEEDKENLGQYTKWAAAQKKSGIAKARADLKEAEGRLRMTKAAGLEDAKYDAHAARAGLREWKADEAGVAQLIKSQQEIIRAQQMGDLNNQQAQALMAQTQMMIQRLRREQAATSQRWRQIADRTHQNNGGG